MAGVPRYREIAEQLRELVLDEESLLGVPLVHGARLPTEPELCDYFKASRGTIRQALRELAAEGLIETRSRAGTFVRRLRMLCHSAHSEHPDRQGTTDTWFAEVIASERIPTQDFGFKILPAEQSVAHHLHIPVDRLVIVRECLRYIDGIPWSEQTSYYEYELGKSCGLDSPHDIPEGTVRRMANHGIREVGHVDQVAARPANPEETALFDLSAGVAVILYRRVGWTIEGPVRYTREILPADRNIVSYNSGDLSAMYALMDDEGKAE